MATKRCKANTAAGTRCRNNAVDGSVYCGVHKAKPKAKKTTTAKKTSSTTRCTATTASGSRCRNKAADGSKFCGLHAQSKATTKKASSSKTTRCTATTQAGKRCKNDALDGSKFCGVHDPNAGSDDVLGELGKLVDSLQGGKSSKKSYKAPDFSGPALLKLLIEFLAGGGKTSGLGALSGLMGMSNLLGGGDAPAAEPIPADSGVSLDLSGAGGASTSGVHLSAATAEMGTMESIWVLLNYVRDNPGRTGDAVREQLAEIMGRLDLGLGR